MVQQIEFPERFGIFSIPRENSGPANYLLDVVSSTIRSDQALAEVAVGFAEHEKDPGRQRSQLDNANFLLRRVTALAQVKRNWGLLAIECDSEPKG